MNKVNPTISSIIIATQLILTGAGAALGQAPAAPAASGPIDITANEQEFCGEQVIAKGNVRVLYKDSIIFAPMATLYKDASGEPNRAVFTGHPRLNQGTSRIDAEMLTFELAAQKIIAVGHAHSEVEGEAEAEKEKKQPEAAAVAPPPEEEVAGIADTPTPDTPPKPVAAAPAPGTKSAGADLGVKKGEKIITDSDRQEYDQATGKFDAMGHVKVVHGDIVVHSDKLQLVYGTNNKPETAVFTGTVVATQNKNTTQADQMTYSLTTKRLQASGNVRSKVIQEKKEGAKKPEGPTAMDILAAPANAKTLPGAVQAKPLFDSDSDKPIYIVSDAQDMSRETGRMTARGNVKVISGDSIGIGPQMIMTRTPEGKADKIYFTGRSQITQPGRRWIADAITFIVDEHRVVAHGNSRAFILQAPGKETQNATPVPQSTKERMAENRKSTPEDQQKPEQRKLDPRRPI